MNQDFRRTLFISVWSLAILSLASLISTKELDVITTLCILVVAPTACYFELKQSLVKEPWLENSLIILLFFGSIFRLIVIKSSFLLIVADFLAAFTLLKLCFKKDEKDLLQIIALSFFLLLSISTLALDSTFLLIFILYVFLSAWTLSLYTLQGRGEIHVETKSIFKFIIRNCILTCVLVLFFSTTIFLFFPRLSLAVFQGAFLGPMHKAGFSESLSLVKPVGKILEDPTIAMRVEVPEKQTSGVAQYLKGQTLSYFDGLEWIPGPHQERQEPKDVSKSKKVQKILKNQFQILNPADIQFLRKDLKLRLDQNSLLSQKIYLEPLEQVILFGVPWTAVIEARLPRLNISEDFAISRPKEFAGRITYEVHSIIERPPERILMKKTTRIPKTPEIEKNLQLPAMNFRQTQHLLSKIVSRYDPPYGKAKKIERYLRENYRYTTQIRTKNTENPTEEFLFEIKQGHCEFFASALALMLRLERIPARIVTGFVMKEWNPSGRYYVVRSKDAHTWVEAYFGGTWIELDASPIASQSELTISYWEKIRQKMDYMNFLWTAHVLSYDMDSQRKLAKSLELKSNQFSQAMERTMETWRKRFWSLVPPSQSIMPTPGILDQPGKFLKQPNRLRILKIFFFLSVFSVAVFLLRKRLRLWIQQWQKTMSSVPWYFYRQMLKILAKKGYKKQMSETPNEFLERIQVTGPMEDAFVTLTRLFYKARFSQQSLSAEDLTTIRTSLNKIKN